MRQIQDSEATMTITLDQARKLHELGVRKKPLKYWGVMNEDYRGKPRIADAWTDLGIYDVVYPAYNAEELFSMIEGGYDINVCEEKTVQVAAWYDVYQGCEYFRANTITEALADKLIHDLENGIISVEEVNK